MNPNPSWIMSMVVNSASYKGMEGEKFFLNFGGQKLLCLKYSNKVLVYSQIYKGLRESTPTNTVLKWEWGSGSLGTCIILFSCRSTLSLHDPETTELPMPLVPPCLCLEHPAPTSAEASPVLLSSTLPLDKALLRCHHPPPAEAWSDHVTVL